MDCVFQLFCLLLVERPLPVVKNGGKVISDMVLSKPDGKSPETREYLFVSRYPRKTQKPIASFQVGYIYNSSTGN